MPTSSSTPRGVLGARCWFAARSTLPPGRNEPATQLFVAVLCATLYGITDEANQAFTPRRSRDVYDVLADAIGGMLGAIACVAIMSRRRAK